MRVLVIPEDFRKDQYVLKPVVEAMLAELGKPRARVTVCMDPLLGSVGQALNRERIREVVGRYPMYNLFLLCVDRDGNPGRRQALDDMERFMAETFPGWQGFFGVETWQEVEVWALAGQDLPSDWNWTAIRAEPHPKEAYFEPWSKQRELTDEPGEGRKTMGKEAGGRYTRVRQKCMEDLGSLEQRLRQWLEGQT